MIKTTSEITVTLIQQMGGDEMCAAAAWVSTSGTAALEKANAEGPERVAGLINYCMKLRHGSIYEQGSLTVCVHAPIFVFREWHRHRIGFSYNEVSGRYSKLEPVFWLPREDRRLAPIEGYKAARPEFVMCSKDERKRFCGALVASYELAYATYEFLCERNYAKEAARACLPVGIYSTCWVTMNPRSLMAFLSLRTHNKDATFVSYPQQEIEIAAFELEKIFATYWPITYKAFCDNGRVGP